MTTRRVTKFFTARPGVSPTPDLPRLAPGRTRTPPPTMRPFLAVVMAAILAVLSPRDCPAGPIDNITFVIDTSPSMADEIALLQSRFGTFHNSVVNSLNPFGSPFAPIPNYSLVRFGGSTTVLQTPVDYVTFTQPGSPFATLQANGGSPQNSTAAVDAGINQLIGTLNPSFGSRWHIILITDHEDQTDPGMYAQIRAKLTGNQFFPLVGYSFFAESSLSVIADYSAATGGNSALRYTPLVLPATSNFPGGSGPAGVRVDIDDFRRMPEDFFSTFSTRALAFTRLEDRGDIPEPGTIFVFGACTAVAAGLAARRRRDARVGAGGPSAPDGRV